MKSDKRLKDDIAPIVSSDDILSLKPVRFKMKGSDRDHYGFIAQDLEQTVFKDLVYENKSGIKSVSYTQFVALLIHQIKKLSERIDKLESLKP